MKTMVTPDEAREIIFSYIVPLETEECEIEALFGRTLAREIVSEFQLPPFDNSAMDGFALRCEDAQNASVENPVVLKVREIIGAGSVGQKKVTTGNCAQIMTGAPIPDGADAVVMREETRRVGETQVAIEAGVRQGQNIRRAGSDVQIGETVLCGGDVVGAAQWGMLASLNQNRAQVFRRPRVAIITTGDEIAPVGDELQPGHIRDSNSWTLRGLLYNCGVDVQHFKIGDDAEILRETLLSCAQTCDAIVTSGGVSMGDFDAVRDVLPQIADVRFWKIAMKPGKPLMFGTIGKVPVWGLPGNPVSVMVGFEQFARPALLKMQGRRAWNRNEIPVEVQAAFRSPAGKVEYVRAKVRRNSGVLCGWVAETTGDQGSGRLSTMTAANALLIVPADVTEVAAGQTLTAQMLDWGEELCP